MFASDLYGLVWSLLIVLLLFCAIWFRYPQRVSSCVPSATPCLWSEIKMTWTMGMLSAREKLPFMKELIRNHGPVVHFRIAGRSYVILNDPEDLRVFLSSSQHIDKSPEYRMLKPWLNEGLLLSSGSKWQTRRKLLTSAFHFKSIDLYNRSVNSHSRVLAKKLLEACNKNEKIDIKEYVTLCSLDILCETIMGTTVNAQQGESTEYVNAIKSACKSVANRILKFWLWNDQIFRISQSGRTFYKSIQVLHGYTDQVITKKRMLLNASKTQNALPKSHDKKQKKSLLEILLNLSVEYPDRITDRDIREEVDTFLFEGHDTSSVALILTLTLLGIHQDVQDKARNELYSIFGDSDRDATMEDLIAMKYIEAIIKESLRLYPSVSTFGRTLQTTLNLTNYSIPPLTTVVVITSILHRNEELYPNPDEFSPDRFLDDDNKSKFLFGYLPFSAGARNCIGQKYAMNLMKTVVSTVLRMTKIESLSKIEDIQVFGSLVLRIESIPKLKFTKI